jgi:phytoene/squalene synthetase
LPDGRAQALRRLAVEALTGLAAARADLRRLPASARPALLAAWRARALLVQVCRDPGCVASGTLGQSEFARRGSLVWATLTGRV